jgi:hypothetical protein
MGMNKGTETSIRRGEATRATHRNVIMDTAKTGEFTVHDIPLDVSVARRALRELCEDYSLIGELAALPRVVRDRPINRGTMIYRAGPPRIMRQSWVKSDNGIRLGAYFPPRPVTGFADLVQRHATC